MRLRSRRWRSTPDALRQVRFATSVAAVIALACLVTLEPTWASRRQSQGLRHNDMLDTSSAKHRRMTEEGGISEYVTDPLIDEPYKSADNRWWIFVHIILIGYMLLGLNTICDSYFTGALDTMVATWNIKPDVAGATFMAAGGSAPELFTSLIGTTISESDVGFGTIVGSAVFNVLFVIGLCGFAAKEPISLTWWPLARDCSFYVCSLVVLATFARTDHEIELWEACVLFCGYMMYCTLMYFNPVLEAKLGVGAEEEGKEEVDASQQSPPKLTQVVPVGDTGSTACFSPQGTEVSTTQVVGSQSQPIAAFAEKHPVRHHIRQPQPHFHRPHDDQQANGMARATSTRSVPIGTLGRVVSKGTTSHEVGTLAVNSGTAPPTGSPPAMEGDAPRAATNDEEGTPEVSTTDVISHEEDVDSDDDPDDIEALMEMPDGRLALVIWIFSLPIYAPLYYLLPKPSNRLFMATFGLSLCWIAAFNCVLVYCVEMLGQVLHIHVIIMGFTLLAAGTSIPDAVSSVAVARAGEGDMAVSSSIGSNIFDILIGLPVPWIIKIGFIEMAGKGRSDAVVEITSDYIVLYVLILIFMVFCVVLSIHFLGWVLNKSLGAGMAVLYAIFLAVVLVVEFEQPDALKM